MRKKVLLISVVDYSDPNGGGLWATNLLDSMARVPDTELVVVSIGDPATAAANDKLIRSLGFTHVFVALRATSTSRPAGRYSRIASEALNMLLDKYHFEWERKARREPHVDSEVAKIVDEHRPDLIVVSYLYSALFAPSVFRRETPVCLINLNKEAQFHRSLRADGGPTGPAVQDRLGRWLYRRFNWLANSRAAAYEKRIQHRCAGIVVLTKSDLPADVPDRVVKAVLPPLFKSSAERWSYRGSRAVFFVGNIAHYPNRLAIEWLCMRFAPALLERDPTIHINIIGASSEHVDADWRSANVRFMGYADKAQVIAQMTSADLFIAPIANKFGAKIKLAECASYGMPFVATEAAMSGLPFLSAIPRIALENPQAAADLIVSHVNAPETLVRLSESVTSQLREARDAQTSAWSSFLNRCIEAG